jgi:hypothetical protein
MSAGLNTRVALIIMAGLVAACGTPRPLNMPTPIGAVMPAAAPMAPAAASTVRKAPTTATAKKTTTPAKTATPAKGATAKPAATKPGATAATKSAADQVSELRAGVQALGDQTENFQAKVQSYNVGPTGEKQSVTVRYTFAKPAQTAIEILKSTQQSAQGAKVLWTGGPKAKIRASVLGLPVKVDLDLTDKNLVNKRGYTFKDTSIEVWQQHITDPGSQITIRGKQMMPNGKQAIVFDCVSPNMMPGITRETYGVDVDTKAPLLCQHYEGETCVYEVQVLDVAFNVQLGTDTFTL